MPRLISFSRHLILCYFCDYCHHDRIPLKDLKRPKAAKILNICEQHHKGLHPRCPAMIGTIVVDYQQVFSVAETA